MSKSKVIYDKFWYLPTTLVDKSGKITLLGHHYTMRQGKTITLTNKIDAFEFQDGSAMAHFIRSKHLRALPDEADGQPRYIPAQVLSLKRKYQEQL